MNPFRFFVVVLRPSPVALALAAATIAFGAYLAWTSPAGFDQVLGIALFLQLFGASTGYRDRLRRGHFDSLLASRSGRASVALAHWSGSVALGLIVSVVLGALDLARGARWPVAFSPAFLVVILYVSTIAWTVSLVVGRYGGAVAWLLTLFALAATGRLQTLRTIFSAAPETASSLISSAIGGLICPIFLMIDPLSASPVLLAVVLAATISGGLLGAVLIARFNGTLAEA
jgi:hypothetical protein